MVGYRHLIFSLALLLFSCAQVGTISGGEKDSAAPKPIMEKMSPPNESTLFFQKEIEISFDEFFRLNNPNTNIRIVPAHATIKTRVKGKSLFLSWDDDLQANTTYAIYLNNVVNDITEGNDSIIQYVFSTGDVLDTLNYRVFVADAWTGKPIDGCLVGIYDLKSEELRSFTETNSFGLAQLNYLKPGQFRLVAFKDENHDLELQEHESIGFLPEDSLFLYASAVDSLPIRLFKPIGNPRIRSVTHVSPGYLLIGATSSMENESVYVNGERLSAEKYRKISDDSLQVFFSISDLSSAEMVISSDLINDTISQRFSAANKTAALSLRPVVSSGLISPRDSIVYFCNDFIESVDTTKISAINLDDSSVITNYYVTHTYNRLEFHFGNRDLLKTIKITMDTGAVRTTHGTCQRFSNTLTFQSENKYGVLKTDLGYYEGQPLILSVISNSKTVRMVKIEEGTSSVRLEGLLPGDYSFSIVRDANNNGKWDVGAYETRTQPELVDHYSSPTKVRANWEVELSLIPKNPR